MIIKMFEDFIYLEAKRSAKLIVHNCNNACEFCPASRLKQFYNYAALNSVFDFDCCDLTIQGNVNSPYLETFLKKLTLMNPKVKIHVLGCVCNLSQEIPLEYSHIIHSTLASSLEMEPKELVYPAIGDKLAAELLIRRYQLKFPEMPIKTQILDAADQNAEFWTDTQIEDFRKQLNIK